MSELDLFGNAIVDDKKPARKQPAPVAAPAAARVDVTVHRPYEVIKTGKCSVMVINSDSAHLFR